MSFKIVAEYTEDLKEKSYATNTSQLYGETASHEIQKWLERKGITKQRLNQYLKDDLEELVNDLRNYPNGSKTFKDFIHQKIQRSYWALGFDGGEGHEGLENFKKENYWQALNYDEDDPRSVAQKAFKYFSKIRQGDFVIIKGFGGRSNLVVHYAGIVINKDEVAKRLNLRPRNITLFRGKAPKGAGAGNWFDTILKVERPEDIKILFKTNPVIEHEVFSTKSLKMKTMPLNQILYGPPGTGKTYNTINLAVEICIPEDEFQEIKHDREKIRSKYDELKEKGQIEFVTFHQSFTYEDFVEGIKPRLPGDEDESVGEGEDPKNKDLIYSITAGIFKRICLKASGLKPSGDFDTLWEEFANMLLDSEEEIIFKSTESEMRLEKEKSSISGFKVRFLKSWNTEESEGTRVFHVGKSAIKRLFDEGIDVSPGAPKQWVNVRDVLGAGRATLSLGVYKRFWEFCDSKGVLNEKPEPLPHVLIIDEINRGNISQIFGELITLIEKDKRNGGVEELEVRLPYSKEQFTIPNNVFIIGTMNTADRSIEALDTALRRRFYFKELSSKPELLSHAHLLWNLWWNFEDKKWEDPIYKKAEDSLYNLIGKNSDLEKEKKAVWGSWEDNKSAEQITDLIKFKFDGINIEKLLRKVNERIELLIDKDHRIGHSYFFSLIGSDNCENELKSIFYDKIIPLLEEYFYGDFGKIGLVLGEAFVETKPGKSIAFAKFKMDDKSVFQDKNLYYILDYRKPNQDLKMTFLEAVRSIYETPESPKDTNASDQD